MFSVRVYGFFVFILEVGRVEWGKLMFREMLGFRVIWIGRWRCF